MAFEVLKMKKMKKLKVTFKLIIKNKKIKKL